MRSALRKIKIEVIRYLYFFSTTSDLIVFVALWFVTWFPDFCDLLLLLDYGIQS